MSARVWRLRGSSDKAVECFLEPRAPTLYAVTVVFGTETFLDEIHPDRASATTRAMSLRDRLLKTGDWTMASPAAPERARSATLGPRR